MELEKAIDRLKAICKQCHNSKECWNNEFCSDCYIEVEDVLAIETVLKAYEELRENSSLDEAIIRADAMLDMDKIWRNKIKEEIEKEKTVVETCYGRIKYQEGKIDVLQDLINEE